MRLHECIFWRFKGEKSYRFGYPSDAGRGLIRMGFWNGDFTHGPIVDATEIETR